MNRLFQSQVSLPGVAAGIAFAMSANTLLLSLMVVMGIWSYRPDELASMGQSFWVISSGMRVLSIAVGVLIAGYVSGPLTRKGLIMTGVVVWAGSFISFGGILPSMAEINSFSFQQIPQQYFWIGLAGDTVALLAAMTAGFISYHPTEPVVRDESALFGAPSPT
jgi:hypothetical protein